MPQPTSQPDENTLREFLLGHLPLDRANEVAAWLEANPSAAERLTDLVAGDPLLAALGKPQPAKPVSPAAVERIILAVNENLRAGEPVTSPLASSRDADTLVEAGAIIAGKYKLLEPIGEGGMGAVWMAQQIEPVKRLVALKLIKSGMDSKSVLIRFEAERQALAMMDHPNIARVLDVGATAAGRPFFVMELVKGTPITEFCDQRKLTPKQRLELFVPVCQAIQHAHQKGIIHRDIKPSNVLVALHDDRPVPKVIDFGVAKAIGTPLTDKTLHTAFEQVVGTPAYMSPEQATFNQLDIDTRSDVYSLGVMLYELLTGTTPIERERFKKAAILEMLRVVREEEPPRLSSRLSSTQARASIAAVRGTEPAKLSKEFRGELDWIAMKALEKDRARRYETANALARDIQRYLADEVVEARPPSMGYRVTKFVRRYKGRVVAASLILLALIGGLVGTSFGIIESANQKVANSLREQAEDARDGEKNARAEVERQREKLAAIEYGRTVQVAYQEWRDNNVAAAVSLLNSTDPKRRGWEWHYVHRLCHSDLLTLEGHMEGLSSALFSADGSRILTTSQDRTAKVWDAKSGAELSTMTMKGQTERLFSASFDADGSRIVTSGRPDHTAKIWDVKTGTVLQVLTGHSHDVVSAAFGADGSRVVTGSWDKTAKVWDAKTGANLVTLKGHSAGVVSVSFSADGLRVVTGSWDTTAKVWDAKSSADLLTLRGHTSIIDSASFSRDGLRVLTGSQDGTAKVWDAKTGVNLLTLKGHSSHVWSASFSVDGEQIVTSSLDGTARVWDAKSGAELLILRGHTSRVTSASFNSDGSRVVTGSDDKTAKVWDAKTGADLTHKGLTGLVQTASFSADWSRVVTGHVDGTAQVSGVKAGAELLTLKGHTKIVHAASFSADGLRIVTGSADETAKVWDAKTGAELLTLKGNAGDVLCVRFDSDGSKVLTAHEGRIARLWDSRTGVELFILKGHTRMVWTATFSADGSRVITGSEDGTAKVWDAKTGADLLTLGTHLTNPGQLDGVSAVAFSADGSRILTGSGDGVARMWDAKTGTELLTLRGHTEAVSSMSLSPDGSRLIIGTAKSAKLWDVKTSVDLITLKDHSGYVGSVAFSADGSRVMTGCYDGMLIVRDSRPMRLKVK